MFKKILFNVSTVRSQNISCLYYIYEKLNGSIFFKKKLLHIQYDLKISSLTVFLTVHKKKLTNSVSLKIRRFVVNTENS